MSEQIPHNQIKFEANYQGNDTELLIERVNNPVIKRQLVDLIMQEQAAWVERLKEEKNWKEFVSSGKLKNKNFISDSGFVIRENEFHFTPKTREEIETDLNNEIQETGASTRIAFSKDEPNPGVINLDWTLPGIEKLTTKQRAIIEAHEKGHRIRPFYKSCGNPRFKNFYEERFLKGFDLSKVVYSEKEYQEDKIGELDSTFEERRERFFMYLFSSTEIVERMSQLKNYFGIKGAELFTKDHLNYAREHYIIDTGIDNRMTQFFQAITSETDDKFIEIINTSGI